MDKFEEALELKKLEKEQKRYQEARRSLEQAQNLGSPDAENALDALP